MIIMPTPQEHAMLSASSADKWLHCTPSAWLESLHPDETSEYAEEGTLAHAFAELQVRKAFIEPMNTRTYNTRLNKLKKHPLYNDEMIKCSEEYLDYINSIVLSYAFTPYVALEKKLDYSVFAPGGFGTGDCIVLGGDTLHIVDYKHGKGIKVEAENNPQMGLYALGAILEYLLTFSIKNVIMTIVQPRLNNISQWSISAEDLINWGNDTVKPAALLASKGEGPFCPGTWCDDHFCKLRAVCRARADSYLEIDNCNQAVPPIISDAEVSAILKRAAGIQKWIKQLESYALNALLSGKEIDGFKAVAGRSARTFDDIDTVIDLLTSNGIEESLLYNRTPATLTAIEKILGKKKFDELLNSHVCFPQGAPTLVPITDKREPYQPQTALSDFKDIEKE